VRDGRENYKCQIQTNYPRKSEIKSEPEWGGEGGGIRLGSEGLIHFQISIGGKDPGAFIRNRPVLQLLYRK